MNLLALVIESKKRKRCFVMACSDLVEVKTLISRSEVVEEKRDDFVEGIIEGLKDFAEGRYTVFKDDDELEAHLMSL